jgi:hypothetical protein
MLAHKEERWLGHNGPVPWPAPAAWAWDANRSTLVPPIEGVSVISLAAARTSSLAQAPITPSSVATQFRRGVPAGFPDSFAVWHASTPKPIEAQ